MGTSYYLADDRYMSTEDIEEAKSFLNENAFVCHRSKRVEGMVYSLGINPIYLFNLPADVKLVNDNSSSIRTIGELADAIKKEDSVLRNPHEVSKERVRSSEDWLNSRPDIGSWANFVRNSEVVDSLFAPMKTAECYLSGKA